MDFNRFHALVVEDDAPLRENLRAQLSARGFQVREAADGVAAVEAVRNRRPDVVLMDVNMPGLSGLEALRQIKEYDPSTLVIILTAYSAIEDAVRAVKDGAYDYLAKPIKTDLLIEKIERAIEARAMVSDIALSAPVVRIDSGEFVGDSREMRKIFQIIQKLAKVDTSVLIRGESGTGKELVARAIHYNSARKHGRLVAINCSSIAETLFESELFGHEKGAFTGADQRQIGRLQYADGGTLFLDEIGDLSMAMQVKLLRVLQERKFTPVGSNREIDMDVRIIAATNRNLEELIAKNLFREDLFYRLNVIPIFLPPLRERKDDIRRLVDHFVAKFNRKHGKQIRGIAGNALERLLEHHWPGNIRELENVVEHAFVIEHSDVLTASSLPSYLRPAKAATPDAADDKDEGVETPVEPFADHPDLDYQASKEKFEREFLLKALKAFKGRINQTALHANIPKKTLLRKLAKYQIRADEFRDGSSALADGLRPPN
jgi:DNA-binding NtrC family response regulator